MDVTFALGGIITRISVLFDLLTTELLLMFRADKGTMRVWRTRKSWKASSNWGTWNLFRFDVMWTCLSVSLSSPDLIYFNRLASQTFAAYKLLTTDPVRFTNSLDVGLIWRAVPDFSASLVLKLSRIYVFVKRERIFHAVSLFALVISSQLQRNTKTFANITEMKRKQTFVFVSCCTAFCAIRKTFGHKKCVFRYTPQF